MGHKIKDYIYFDLNVVQELDNKVRNFKPIG